LCNGRGSLALHGQGEWVSPKEESRASSRGELLRGKPCRIVRWRCRRLKRHRRFRRAHCVRMHFSPHLSLDGKVCKRSSRHECRPLCPPSDSGGKSKLDAYALLHAAVGGWPFTPLLHRMSASPTHSATWRTTTIFPSCFLLHQCESTIPQANAVSTAESQVTALQYKHIKNFRMEIFTLIPLLRIACGKVPFLCPFA